MRSVRCKLSLVASGLAIVLLAGSVGAEVGVPVDTELSSKGGLYQILMLSDDPDPYLGFWVDVTASHTPSRIALNTDGDVNGDGPPSVLMNPFSGLPTVAWARNSASGFDVVVSHFAAGAWSAPEVVAGGTGYSQGDQLTVVGGAGVTTPAVFQVDQVSGGTVTAVSKVASGQYEYVPDNPVATTGNGTWQSFRGLLEARQSWAP